MPCTHCPPCSRDISPLQRFLPQSQSHYDDQVIKKPGKKSRLLKYMSEFVSKDDVKLPPVPVSDGILGLKLPFIMLQEYTCIKA